MKQLFFPGLCLLLLAGCSTSTKITASWKNPDIPARTYKKIFVAALTGSVSARTIAESNIGAALEKNGFIITKSISAFPPGNTRDSITLQQIMDKVRADETDAILTVALLKEKTETRYVPGTYYGYAPMLNYGYYGRFGGYYSYWYPYLWDPGYYVQDDVYFIETNLYDAHSDALVWSAQSKTYNPASLSPFSKEFAERIAVQLKKEGIVPPGNTKGEAATK